jgi:triosephosphate isomerase (TIM)
MKKIIIANWKENPVTLKEAEFLLKDYPRQKDTYGSELIVCPPTIYLQPLTAIFGKQFTWGAQDCFWEPAGAFTGGISPQMLKSISVRYVIIGHSERREHFGEDDVAVNKKLSAALKAGWIPLLCVGGGKEAKNKHADAKKIVKKQLSAALRGIPPQRLPDILLCYEPPWALSTISDYAPAPFPLVKAMTDYIHKFLNKNSFYAPRILYGGSINNANVLDFISNPLLAGFLVGGLSLKPSDLKKIFKLIA